MYTVEGFFLIFFFIFPYPNKWFRRFLSYASANKLTLSRSIYPSNLVTFSLSQSGCISRIFMNKNNGICEWLWKKADAHHKSYQTHYNWNCVWDSSRSRDYDSIIFFFSTLFRELDRRKEGSNENVCVFVYTLLFLFHFFSSNELMIQWLWIIIICMICLYSYSVFCLLLLLF